jgi:hypothetical protein
MTKIAGPDIMLYVTDEHKMVTIENDTINMVKAADLTFSETYYKGCIDIDLSDTTLCEGNTMNEDMAYIYGLYFKRGYSDLLTNQVSIHRTRRAEEILQRLQLETHEEHGLFLMFYSPEITKEFRKSFEIQSCVLATRAIANAFLDGYFDGETTRSTGCFDADIVQLVAIKAGKAITITQDQKNHRSYNIELSDSVLIGSDKYSHSQEEYTGPVFCVEVPSHIFMVRMQGKCVWTGNSSRHGQKGTIGMLYTHADMPFTKDGVVPDIIVNPHAIPSRMTIAQLMECIMGKACCAKGCYGDASPFTELSVTDISDVLKGCGLEEHGNEILYNSRTGEQMQTNIFIGPTYYQRLKHMVNDKVHSRSSCGPVVLLTRQPAEGRARDGGLRLGEMEQECNWGHGISSFLKERNMECSDNYRVFVCKKCNMMCNVNPEKGIHMCNPCKNTTMFAEIRIPYTAKLLFHEVQTMSIGTKFITA